jgi:prepilin-type N-terminal cleavage/methylation domain-containing protein
MRNGRAGFTVLELMVSIVIVAILISLLVPMLLQGRRHALQTVCMNNVRQIGIGWQAYIGDHEVFPTAEINPAWRFAGVRFVGGAEARPVADEARPLTDYLHPAERTGGPVNGSIYRCPEDRGLSTIVTPDQPSVSLTDFRTCYTTFGNSYRGNEMLLDARRLGVDQAPRGLRAAEVSTTPTRLVLFGDPVWFFATKPADDSGQRIDASWHMGEQAGHIATLDGAVRHMSFADGTLGALTAQPR